MLPEPQGIQELMGLMGARVHQAIPVRLVTEVRLENQDVQGPLDQMVDLGRTGHQGEQDPPVPGDLLGTRGQPV